MTSWFIAFGLKGGAVTETSGTRQRHRIIVDSVTQQFSHSEDEISGSKDSSRKNRSFIMRVLHGYYGILHSLRYILLIVFGAGFVTSIFYALRLRLPDTSAVRQLPENHETEMRYIWSTELLDVALFEQIGRQVQVLWGVTPSDNGNYLDPYEGSRLVLEDSFDPTPIENQLYLQEFCRELLKQDFVNPSTDDFQCPFDVFETWLLARSNTSEYEPNENCPLNATFPVEPSLFNPCVKEFISSDIAEDTASDNRIYLRNGEVRILRLPYRQTGIRFDSGYSILNAAWKLFDGFLETKMEEAPDGVNKAFGSSFDFWWYDTNGKMFFTAYAGTAIALSAVFVVLLCSCRSIKITLFAVFTIADILSTVSMLLTLSGWTLGFLEAICFAILVGMSCDFVLHFSHAYCSLPGVVDRHERTLHALTSMGPSILAAAITTIAAAIVMMFAQISFFRRFALILLYTLSVGLIASMVLFFVLSDTFGPSEPTKLIDGILSSWWSTSVGTEGSDDSTEKKTITTTTTTVPSRAHRRIHPERGFQFVSHRVVESAPSTETESSGADDLRVLALAEEVVA